MSKFSFKTKNKKILFSLLSIFLLSITIFSIPQTVAAWEWPWNWGDNIFNGILNGLLIFLMAGPILIVLSFSNIANILLQTVLTFAIGTSYINAEAVNVGWPVVRDLANMIIVLGFVVVGIATALRFREYEAKQILPKLIGAALLINFSKLICGIFIDGTNIMMNYFFTAPGTWSTWIPAISDISSLIWNIDKNIFTFAPKLLAMVFFNFLAGFVYLLYAVILLSRVIALWILVILSPLAFACYVFPATKGIWQMWWKNFFQWCIVTIPLGLFYYIGVKMIHSNAITGGFVADENVKDYIGNALSTVFVPAGILIVGFFVSLGFAPLGASSIMGFANKYKGKALMGGLGALSKGSGAMASKLKDSGYGQAVANLENSTGTGAFGKSWAFAKRGAGKVLGAPIRGGDLVAGSASRTAKTMSTVGRLAEGAGYQTPGTQALKDKAKVDDLAKSYTAAYVSGNASDKSRVENTAVNGTGVERAAAVQALASEKSLGKVKAFQNNDGTVNFDRVNEAISHAESFGASRNIRKNAEKSMPGLAGYNKTTIEELTGRPEQISEIDRLAGRFDPNTNTRRGGEINQNTGQIYTEAEAALQVGLKINQDTGKIYTRPEAQREATRRIISDMNVADMRALPASQMNTEFFEHANPKTLRQAALEFSGDQRERGRIAVPELRDRRNQSIIDAHISMGGQPIAANATADDRKNYYDQHLSDSALQNRYNSMSQSEQQAWGNLLNAEERRLYDEHGGINNAAEAYSEVQKHRLNITSRGRVSELEEKIRAIKSFNK